MRKVDVTFDNALQVRNGIIMKDRFIPTKHPNRMFTVDDCVRIERHKHLFQKGYEPNFTIELFRISFVSKRPLPVKYQLTDGNREVFERLVLCPRFITCP